MWGAAFGPLLFAAITTRKPGECLCALASCILCVCMVTYRQAKRKGNTKMKMTIRELRQALTEIDNQNLTVRELRAILFEQEEQDRELHENDLFKLAYRK